MRTLLLPALTAALLTLCCCDEQPTNEAKPAPAVKTAAELQATEHFCGDNAYIHCAALCAMGSRPSGSAAYEQQLRYLSRYLEEYGWAITRHSFTAPNGTPMVNLHATFGAQATARPILLTCHIDTKQGICADFQGADDGASGAAAIVELARVLAKEPQLATQIELVFFDGEESFAPRMTEKDGLYGSKFDVARRGAQLPLYQVNLDMVGARNKVVKVPLFDTDPTLAELYLELVEEQKLSPKRWQLADESYMDDDLPFRRAGVATINIIADFVGSIWWHTPRDNMSRICPKSLEETGTLTLALLRRISAQ